MDDSSCCLTQAGSATCAAPARTGRECPECGKTGKPVEGQTVRALVSISLRDLIASDYLFCRTQACPVVYFSASGRHVITVDQVREHVYQKDPGTDDVCVCYCFHHTVGEIRAASDEMRMQILDDINDGIDAGQCACDLRNPQGSCCLGNARELMRRPGGRRESELWPAAPAGQQVSASDA